MKVLWQVVRGVIVFFVGMGALILAVGAFMNRSTEPSAPPPPKTEAQIQAEKAKKDEEDKQAVMRGRVVTLARAVKERMRDPDSLVWEEMRANEDGSVVCLEYRAKNGFGGMNREFVIYAKETLSAKSKDYNRHCTQPLKDVKHLRYSL